MTIKQEAKCIVYSMVLSGVQRKIKGKGTRSACGACNLK